MDNYHYIICGLPALTQDFEHQKISYPEIVAEIRKQLSGHDSILIKWLEYGLDSSHLSEHFYHALKKCRSPFLTEWFEFDRNVRNSIVRYVSEKEHLDGMRYAIGSTDPHFEEEMQLQKIFQTENIMERELALDRMKWDRLNGMTEFHYFDMEIIMSFIIKCDIIRRWMEMDRKKGAEIFERLVQEVRGTFKGIHFNTVK